MNKVVEILQRTKAIEILITLHGSKNIMNFRELARSVGGSFGTIHMRLNELIHAGLVEDSQRDSFPYDRKLSITLKGKRATEMIIKAIKIMEAH